MFITVKKVVCHSKKSCFNSKKSCFKKPIHYKKSNKVFKLLSK